MVDRGGSLRLKNCRNARTARELRPSFAHVLAPRSRSITGNWLDGASANERTNGRFLAAGDMSKKVIGLLAFLPLQGFYIHRPADDLAFFLSLVY